MSVDQPTYPSSKRRISHPHMNGALIITIDTEEEGLWSDTFRGAGNTASNVNGVPNFQSVCDNHALKPTYLVNSPVVADDNAASIIAAIAEHGGCEVGCHIHPWNTPPFVEDISVAQSYLCNLPLHEQRARLETVTRQIQQRFGAQPRSFRAGRYGLDAAGAEILQELGYIVDSSVCPFMDYSADGGPDFRGAPWRPYHIGADIRQPAAAGETGGLLEVPVSFGFNWANFPMANGVYEALAHPSLKPLRFRGIAGRLGLLNKIKFSPEKNDAKALRQLANSYRSQNSPCLVMMFHSSSLVPGMSPYVTTPEDLKTFLETIDKTIDYCLNHLGMHANTLSEFATDYLAQHEHRAAA